jgi:hypothetical protein
VREQAKYIRDFCSCSYSRPFASIFPSYSVHRNVLFGLPFFPEKKKKKKNSWHMRSLCCQSAFQLLNYVTSIHGTYYEHYFIVVDPSIVRPIFLRFLRAQRRHIRTWDLCDTSDTLGYQNRRKSGGSHDDVSSGMLRYVSC